MENLDNDILISAYLDGELTAEEQSRVEQLLATSAEARQLVDELRTIRAGLKELPQHKLGPDFAAQVIERAQREAVATSEPSPSGRGQGEGAGTLIGPIAENANRSQHSQPGTLPADESELSPLPRFWKNPRGLAWSAVAIAIAVMIMVTSKHADRNNVGGQGQHETVVARCRSSAISSHRNQRRSIK